MLTRAERIWAMMVALAMLVILWPTAALANEHIDIDIATATLDELMAAQSIIEARIDELTQTEATEAPSSADESIEATDTIRYEGDGTSIVDNVQLPYDYNAITYAASSNASYKLRDASGNQISYSLGRNQCDIVAGPTTAKLLVEGKDAWMMDIAPLTSTDALTAIEGTGCYISPAFPLDTDRILNVQITNPSGTSDFNDMLSIYCTMYRLMQDGSLRADSLIIGDSMGEDGTYDADLILSPVEGATGYVLVLNVRAQYTWSLTLK